MKSTLNLPTSPRMTNPNSELILSQIKLTLLIVSLSYLQRLPRKYAKLLRTVCHAQRTISHFAFHRYDDASAMKRLRHRLFPSVFHFSAILIQ